MKMEQNGVIGMHEITILNRMTIDGQSSCRSKMLCSCPCGYVGTMNLPKNKTALEEDRGTC